jgi:hypothetical protein
MPMRPRWSKVTRQRNEYVYELFEDAARDDVIMGDEIRMIRAALHDARKAARCADTGEAAGQAMARVADPETAMELVALFANALNEPDELAS